MKIEIELDDVQIERLAKRSLWQHLNDCTPIAVLNEGRLCFSFSDGDGESDETEFLIDIEKELTYEASGNWIASDYKELSSMVESIGRIYKFMQEYQRSCEK